MKISFASNFINHHQLPFCDEMYRRLSEDFAFIECQPMDESRISMGWDASTSGIEYLCKAYEDEAKSLRLIRECDILILGWTGLPKDAPIEVAIRDRLNSGSAVIRISERIYREGRFKAVSPRGLKAKYDEHIRFRNYPVYMLCAGAYVSGDFHLIGAYPGKMFKWGYFPPLRRYDGFELEKLLYKNGDRLELCFAGRLIKLKHPEMTLLAAKHLKEKNIPYRLHILGEGPLRSDLENTAKSMGISEDVIFHGAASPTRVRDVMEKSHIFFFCSNYLEGWGAVVNEAMNSACAVIASSEAGASPFLIRNGENGLLYDRCSGEEFLHCLDLLTCDFEKIRSMQRSAYHTIEGEWNAEHACMELLKFCESLLHGKNNGKDHVFELPESGPMSFAKVLKAPGIFRTLKEDNHLE